MVCFVCQDIYIQKICVSPADWFLKHDVFVLLYLTKFSSIFAVTCGIKYIQPSYLDVDSLKPLKFTRCKIFIDAEVENYLK